MATMTAKNREKAALKSSGTVKSKKFAGQFLRLPTIEEQRAKLRANCFAPLDGCIGDAIAEQQKVHRELQEVQDESAGIATPQGTLNPEDQDRGHAETLSGSGQLHSTGIVLEDSW